MPGQATGGDLNFHNDCFNSVRISYFEAEG
jgi:hypothetical protein